MHPHANWQIPPEWGPADNQPRNAAPYLSLSLTGWPLILVSILAIGPKAKLTTFAIHFERINEVAPGAKIVELQLMVPPWINGTTTWQLERVVEVYGELQPIPPLARTYVYVLESGQQIGYQFPEPVDVTTEYLDLLYSSRGETSI